MQEGSSWHEAGGRNAWLGRSGMWQEAGAGAQAGLRGLVEGTGSQGKAAGLPGLGEPTLSPRSLLRVRWEAVVDPRAGESPGGRYFCILGQCGPRCVPGWHSPTSVFLL